MDADEGKYKPRDYVVGSFLLLGTLVILVGIFAIRGLGLTGANTYHARYSNVSALEAGAAVKYHGLLVGRVTEMALDPEDAAKIRVTLEVKENTPVTSETVARIAKADLLGDEFVDLRSRGAERGTPADLREAGERLPDGATLIAGEPFDLGVALEQAQQVIELLHDVAVMVQGQAERVFVSLGEIAENANSLLSEENRATLEGALSDLAGTAAQARQIMDANAPRIESSLQSVQEATETLRDVASDVDVTLTDLRPRLEQLTTSLESAVRETEQLVVKVRDGVDTVDLQGVNDLVGNLETTSRNLAEFTREIKDKPYLLIRKEKPSAASVP